MPTSVISNGQDFRFKGIDLHGDLESWDDDLPVRLATYEYLKRDGAEVEPMGAGQKKWTFKCVFLGSDCGARYRKLAASIQQDPRGELIHPRLGRFDAACTSLRAQENPGQAIDMITFAIEIAENQVDQSIQANEQFGAQRRASYLQDALTKVAAATSSVTGNHIANEIFAAVTAAVALLGQIVLRFIELALQIAQATPDQIAQDPTLVNTEGLDKLLLQLRTQRDTTVVEIGRTTIITLESDVSLTDAKTACYLTYASALELYNAALAQRPSIVEWPVPAAMPLTTIAVRIYGKRAKTMMGTIYALNRIQTPFWVPAGTKIRVLAPSAEDG